MTAIYLVLFGIELVLFCVLLALTIEIIRRRSPDETTDSVATPPREDDRSSRRTAPRSETLEAVLESNRRAFHTYGIEEGT